MAIRNVKELPSEVEHDSREGRKITRERLFKILQQHPNGMLTSELGKHYGGLNRDVRNMMSILLGKGKVRREKEESSSFFCGRKGRRKEFRWFAIEEE